jgi:DNA-binding MarR family transcriptional regulator
MHSSARTVKAQKSSAENTGIQGKTELELIQRDCEKTMSPGKLSHTVAILLKALSLGYQFGFEIMEVTGLPSGSVYPALRRLERDGLVTSDWEAEAEAIKEQRPARRYYQLTRAGRETESTATQRYPLLTRLIPQKLGKSL